MFGMKREKPTKEKKKIKSTTATTATTTNSASDTSSSPEAFAQNVANDYAKHRLSKTVLSYSVASTSGMLSLILDRIDSDGIKPFIKRNAVVRFSPLNFLNESLEKPTVVEQGEFVPVPQFNSNSEAVDKDDVEVNIL